MPCDINKIDSNVSGLRFAEEACLKDLPNMAEDGRDPIWFVQEPNSYSDFGGQVAMVARNPINSSRQRRKGTVTDVDASGGYNSDVTLTNLTRIMQGFLFADAREKPDTQPLNGAAVVITGVTAVDDTYAAAAGLGDFLPGNLVLASGFSVPANNGLKTVDASTAGTVVVLEALTDEAAPPTTGKLEVVGFEFPTADVDIVMNGNLVRLESAAGGLEDLGLIPGEWIFLGGDLAANKFANNAGFARVGVVDDNYLEFDKVNWPPVAESGAAKNIRIFYGKVIQNENDPALIKRRSYHLERTLGEDDDGTMSEYLVGAVPNEFTLNVQQADKVTADLAFVACDFEYRSGAQGVKAGARPELEEADAFNTSSDFSRTKMSSVDNTSANVTPLYAFITELTLTVNNNVSPNKAIGVLGAFDTTAGTFEVGGSLTAYFANVAAVQAVRNNADITLDVIMVKDNAGLMFDVPLLSLGNGRLNIEQDQPITIPLETNAAKGKFGSTLVFQSFPYLPDAADV